VLVVIARYQAKPGEGDAVAAILARHTAQTRAEPGCLAFLGNRSAEDGDRFVLYEQYADEAAFQAHRASPHFRANIEGDIARRLASREWERHVLIEPAPTAAPPGP
jgi:quinol monooxygenase YgiN